MRFITDSTGTRYWLNTKTGDLVELKSLGEHKPTTTMVTNKYKTLVVYDEFNDFLESKYNKCAMFVYCVESTRKNTKNNKQIIRCTLITRKDNMEFSSNENFFKNKHKLDNIFSSQGYMIVLEKNNNRENRCDLLEARQVKTDEQFLNQKQ